MRPLLLAAPRPLPASVPRPLPADLAPEEVLLALFVREALDPHAGRADDVPRPAGRALVADGPATLLLLLLLRDIGVGRCEVPEAPRELDVALVGTPPLEDRDDGLCVPSAAFLEAACCARSATRGKPPELLDFLGSVPIRLVPTGDEPGLGDFFGMPTLGRGDTGGGSLADDVRLLVEAADGDGGKATVGRGSTRSLVDGGLASLSGTTAGLGRDAGLVRAGDGSPEAALGEAAGRESRRTIEGQSLAFSWELNAIINDMLLKYASPLT